MLAIYFPAVRGLRPSKISDGECGGGDVGDVDSAIVAY